MFCAGRAVPVGACLRRFRYSETEVEEARRWVAGLRGLQLPQDLFKVGYSRAQGAGGQKVNKTSVQATVLMERREWEQALWMPPAVREQVSKPGFRYRTAKGNIVVLLQFSRLQFLNRADAFDKLARAFQECVYFDRPPLEELAEKWRKIGEREDAKRLVSKKIRSEQRASRKKVEW